MKPDPTDLPAPAAGAMKANPPSAFIAPGEGKPAFTAPGAETATDEQMAKLRALATQAIMATPVSAGPVVFQVEAGPAVGRYAAECVNLMPAVLARLAAAQAERDAAVRERDRLRRENDDLRDEADPVAFPDGAAPMECVGHLLHCAALHSPASRLVGNLRAGDIVRSLSAVVPDAVSVAARFHAAHVREFYEFAAPAGTEGSTPAAGGTGGDDDGRAEA